MLPLKLFTNRQTAGIELAKYLIPYQQQPNTVLLAISRGGVPVAFSLAMKLQLAWDMYLVRKLKVPGQPRLVIGAIANDDITVFNEELLATRFVTTDEVGALIEAELSELARKNALYRHSRPLPDIKDCTVILVDDGLATGSSMRAAIAAIKKLQPKKLVVAVPVGSLKAIVRLQQEVDDLICIMMPDPFYGIANWYEDFPPINDEEIIKLLNPKLVIT